MRAEQITPSITYHGEGPVWSESWGGLRFVDMLAGDILTLADTGSVTREHVGAVAAVVRPRRGGGAVIGLERGFGLQAPDGSVQALAELWSAPDIRMNEGGCDPDGRFYCGSMAYDKRQGAGKVYRLDPDLSTRIVLEDVTISNGLEWSPDGALAYYNDTPTGRIAVFDYDRDAGLTGRRTFVEIPDGHGHPDGLTVDADGGVWTALYGSGTVHRYSPEGKLDEVIEVGPKQVTACTFGGAGLDELFITTSREELAPDEQPQAGALFRAKVGVTGMPVRPFAG
ncbi:SMP-30/gluconolactonase/LRE family protein [Cryobacterium tepidiphilum]|uniref:SMP-30/gluconolactonase/LRE family protein n=1 Tax=Cryobacterium tepidiphilum TaxID=2486026 RepID=A0A3M8LLV9_9MICO|nr:SMP-30/gluconolactonase/LRE family protein [Cryobacterium tepidiphilum]RNE66460.1 SMP-30/gluconolactonase/LRE family protein [Cryobacterium tepidiphilum]